MKFVRKCFARLKGLTAQLLTRCLPRLKTAAKPLCVKCPPGIKAFWALLKKNPAVIVSIATISFCIIFVLMQLVTNDPAIQTDAPEEVYPDISIPNKVGVSLATEQNSTLSTLLTEQLEQRGFTVSLLCADGSTTTQREQLQTLLSSGVSCLIIQPVDSLTLSEPLQLAKTKNIPVIACDDMLMDTDWVWCYVGFDYYTLGKAMAKKIVENQNLATAGESRTIEFFMGAPERQNSVLLYKGAMEVFDPYLRAGRLKVPSNRVYFEDTYTADTIAGAKESCLLRLKVGKPDILFAGSDEIAEGCRQALMEKDYEKEEFPTIIGQGGSGGNAVKEGTQLATYVKAPVLLAAACAESAALALSGEFLEDFTTQHNHVINVPTRLLSTSLVDS